MSLRVRWATANFGMKFLLIMLLVYSCACTSRVVFENAPDPAGREAVNINTASVVELEGLPGIGRKTAEAIVEHRTRNGAFHPVEQIMLVQGMSEKRFLEMRDLITN